MFWFQNLPGTKFDLPKTKFLLNLIWIWQICLGPNLTTNVSPTWTKFVCNFGLSGTNLVHARTNMCLTHASRMSFMNLTENLDNTDNYLLEQSCIYKKRHPVNSASKKKKQFTEKQQSSFYVFGDFSVRRQVERKNVLDITYGLTRSTCTGVD